MKTLDEVIKALEVCRDLKIECDRCPYGDMHSMNGERLKCIEGGLYPDAIHYLKEYSWMDKALDPEKRGENENAR